MCGNRPSREAAGHAARESCLESGLIGGGCAKGKLFGICPSHPAANEGGSSAGRSPSATVPVTPVTRSLVATEGRRHRAFASLSGAVASPPAGLSSAPPSKEFAPNCQLYVRPAKVGAGSPSLGYPRSHRIREAAVDVAVLFFSLGSRTRAETEMRRARRGLRLEAS